MLLRAIFVVGAAAAFLDAALIMVSLQFGAGGATVAVSSVVALLLIGAAALLLGTDRHLVRARSVARNLGDPRLCDPLERLSRHLGLAGFAAVLVMLLLLAMILQRMGEGFAVFG
ncbi:MAG: hypothetical protein AcusKO_08370 [Acuticoccus sp.]